MAKETTLYVLKNCYIMQSLWHDLAPKSFKRMFFVLDRKFCLMPMCWKVERSPWSKVSTGQCFSPPHIDGYGNGEIIRFFLSNGCPMFKQISFRAKEIVYFCLEICLSGGCYFAFKA